jgi:hypothetical protein
MHSLRQQQRRRGVPQVMKPEIGQIGLPDQSLELRHRHVDVQRLPQLRNREGTGGEVIAPRGMRARLDSLLERVASQRC